MLASHDRRQHAVVAPGCWTLTDSEVVARVCAGEAHLFEVLMRRHNELLYRATRAILRDDIEAEDVMQHAYARAYEHLATFERRARFSTWLTRIAVYEALARAKRSRRFVPLDSPAGDERPVASSRSSPEDQASDLQIRSLLEKAIDALSTETRVVFVLREIEGLSTIEVADCLGIGEQNVKARLLRARRRLQGILRPSLEPVLPVYGFHRCRCDRVVVAVMRSIAPL
jgi:RNA polymerase sigma-70 factor, ECF subfamily